MNPEDKTEFQNLMIEIGKTYTKEIDQDLLRIYWKALNILTIEEMKKAINAHVKTSAFFPKPSELLETIKGKNGGKGQQSFAWIMENVKF